MLNNNEEQIESNQKMLKTFKQNEKLEKEGSNDKTPVTFVTLGEKNKDLLTVNDEGNNQGNMKVTRVTNQRAKVTNEELLPRVTLDVTLDISTEEKVSVTKVTPHTHTRLPFLEKSSTGNQDQEEIVTKYHTSISKMLIYFETTSKKDFLLALLYFAASKREQVDYHSLVQKTKIKYDTIKTYAQRMVEEGTIQKTETRPIKVTITPKGIQYIEDEWEQYLKKQEGIDKSVTTDPTTNKYANLECFFSTEPYYSLLLEAQRCGNAILVNFSDFVSHNIDLAEMLLDYPEEFFNLAETTVRNITTNKTKISLHFFNLPTTNEILIGSLRNEHIDKFITIVAELKQKSSPRPEVVWTDIECNGCGRRLIISGNVQIPKQCTKCEWVGFRVVEEKCRDMLRVVLQEQLDSYDEERQPRFLNAIFYDENASYESDKKLVVGQKIKIFGILKKIKVEKKMYQTRTYDFLFVVNHFEMMEETFTDIKITKEDLKQIEEMQKDSRLMENICESIWGDIYDREYVKKALLLQQFSASQTKTIFGVKKRMQSHILLIGDAGLGKSHFLKGVKKIAPKWRLAAGGGTTGVGLVGSVIKNEFLGMPMLEAGVVTSANNGIALLEEFDKISPEDRQLLHQAMEDQEATITKWNIQSTLPARTAILACANPKYGRFDPNSTVLSQINMPPTLLSRFDLIFVLRDIPEIEKDQSIAERILAVEKEDNRIKYSYDIIRKYIAYARQNFSPTISEEQKKLIIKEYTKLRLAGYDKETNVVSFTTRQLQGIIRLAMSSALFHMSNEIRKEDITLSFSLMLQSLGEIATNRDGKIDVNMIEMMADTKERGSMAKFDQLILDCERDKQIFDSDLIIEAKKRGIDEEVLIKQINNMIRDGKLARQIGNPIIYRRVV